MIVPVASLVWSVEKTKCPVSAAISVMAIVSASRISPTKMMSGSCRSISRSPCWNDLRSLPISRCEIIDCFCGKMYSIGSSAVIIRQALFSLIRSIIEAMVVDFPAPVMPVTRTRPCLRAMMSSHTLFGKPISSSFGMSIDSARIAPAKPSFSAKILIRNCKLPIRYEQSTLRSVRSFRRFSSFIRG